MNPTNHYKYHLPLVYGFLLLFLFSCQSIKSDQYKKSEKDSVLAPPATSTAVAMSYDTIITTPCAILIYPTPEQIEEMKRRYKDSNDFYTVADDNQFYMGTSIEYLDSAKVKIYTRDAKGNIIFKINPDHSFTVPIGSLKWNILLFNGKDQPKNADITFIQDEYKSYMLK